MTEKGKMAIKKWDFSDQMRVFGSEKIASGRLNRKAKWCKMQVLFLKTDKLKDVKC